MQAQPHWLSTWLPPQVSGGVQSPQLASPQPVSTVPQDAPSWAHVLGVHPHWLSKPPPPQTWGALHAPQSNAWLHPSETKPQDAPSWVQVLD